MRFSHPHKLGGWPLSTSTPTWARASASGASVTTTPCSASSPAPTWRAASMPATPPACCGYAGPAAERGVRIGAQVSYRDLAGFGRRFIDVAAEDLVADVVYQIGALQAIAQAAGSAVSYVKPHGALYNTIVTNREQARRGRRGGAPGGPHAAGAGHGGFGVFRRGRPPRLAHGGRGVRRSRLPAGRPAGFPPRTGRGAARPGGDRRPRGDHGGRRVGSPRSTAPTIAVSVESVCVHGDSPGAVQIATAVRDQLTAAGTEIKAFC